MIRTHSPGPQNLTSLATSKGNDSGWLLVTCYKVQSIPDEVKEEIPDLPSPTKWERSKSIREMAQLYSLQLENPSSRWLHPQEASETPP